MKTKELVNDFRLRAKEAGSDPMALRESFRNSRELLARTIKEEKIDCKRFSMQELFSECFGEHELKHSRSLGDINWVELREAAGAVSTSAFQNISGQIAYGMTLEAFESPEFVVTKTIPEYSGSRTQGLEKVAGISAIGDETADVLEGDDYPIAGVNENWIFLNEPVKRGFRVPLTKEAIHYDRTGLLVKNCQEVGYSYGQYLEKQAVNCLVDENTSSTNTSGNAFKYNWRGTIISTYGDSSGSHNWDNLQASNALVDWTDIENAQLLLSLMADPFTGEPILFPPTHLYVPRGLEWTARRILAASTVQVVTPGYQTSGNATTTEAPNPVMSLGLTLVTTPYMEAQMATDTSWYLGNPAKGIVKNVHFPMEVTQAPANSEDDFKRDIVMQFKVSGKMGFQWKEPRAFVKSTA